MYPLGTIITEFIEIPGYRFLYILITLFLIFDKSTGLFLTNFTYLLVDLTDLNPCLERVFMSSLDFIFLYPNNL